MQHQRAKRNATLSTRQLNRFRGKVNVQDILSEQQFFGQLKVAVKTGIYGGEPILTRKR